MGGQLVVDPARPGKISPGGLICGPPKVHEPGEDSDRRNLLLAMATGRPRGGGAYIRLKAIDIRGVDPM